MGIGKNESDWGNGNKEMWEKSRDGKRQRRAREKKRNREREAYIVHIARWNNRNMMMGLAGCPDLIDNPLYGEKFLHGGPTLEYQSLEN